MESLQICPGFRYSCTALQPGLFLTKILNLQAPFNRLPALLLILSKPKKKNKE
jgi:hypothetical protein